MKTINLDLKKDERQENCVFACHDYKKKRKGDANCFATAVHIKHVDTIELIKIFVNMIAYQHKDKQFYVEHDGIITFTIQCNDQILFEGNHYDVENMMQEGTYVFRDLLLSRMKECTL